MPSSAPWLRVALEGADEQSAYLLSNIEGGIRVTKHRQLDLERAELVELLGDEIVVLEGHDRKIDPDHAADLLCPLAGGIDDDLSPDLALRGRDAPARAGSLDRGHDRVPEDLRPHGARALRERLGQAVRIDVSVCWEVGCADDAVQIDQWEEQSGLLRRHDLEGHAQHVGDALPIPKLVEPIL